MAALNPYNQYREQSINTATPGMLIVMLFDEAIKNINAASRHIGDHNIQDAHNAIIKVQNIYGALKSYLNDNVPLAANLGELYDYIIKRLVEANIKKDRDVLAEILSFTTEFRDTWKEAEKRVHISAASGK